MRLISHVYRYIDTGWISVCELRINLSLAAGSYEYLVISQWHEQKRQEVQVSAILQALQHSIFALLAGKNNIMILFQKCRRVFVREQLRMQMKHDSNSKNTSTTGQGKTSIHIDNYNASNRRINASLQKEKG